MNKTDDIDLDTWQRTDIYIARLMRRRPLTIDDRRDLELLLRRYRKRYFGSALTDRERQEGKPEISP